MQQAIKIFYDRNYAEATEIPRSSKSFALDCVPGDFPLDILDVGCGSGANSLALAAKGHRLFGIDISEVAIERYRRHGFEGRAADIESGLGYPDANFDLVFCSEVIEHMVMPQALAEEMFRVLKPGGRLVLSTPNSAFWLYRLLGVLGYTSSELQHPRHLQFFSRRSLHRVLAQAGFAPLENLGRNMYLLLPAAPQGGGRLLAALGFQKEGRFRTKTFFWHLSHRSRFWNTLFADTLICIGTKPAAPSSCGGSRVSGNRSSSPIGVRS